MLRSHEGLRYYDEAESNDLLMLPGETPQRVMIGRLGLELLVNKELFLLNLLNLEIHFIN